LSRCARANRKSKLHLALAPLVKRQSPSAAKFDHSALPNRATQKNVCFRISSLAIICSQLRMARHFSRSRDVSAIAGGRQPRALAAVLLGNLDPAGRLPVFVVRSPGCLPSNYDLTPGGDIHLSFTVSNLSNRDGIEIVPVYFHATTSRATRLLLRLVCVEKFRAKAIATRCRQITVRTKETIGGATTAPTAATATPPKTPTEEGKQ
jgi:hypothetical protein